MSKPSETRRLVQSRYAVIAESGCGDQASGCCGGGNAAGVTESSLNLGYDAADLARLPEGADLGLGCGNPQAIASLGRGEVVLDLGSGAGIDCFMAAQRVGDQGRVIGVDMTPAMLDKARSNAARGGYDNVEFRLGEIEYLPVADVSVDVIISNCVINLSPDKPAVFREAFRVLRPGGRLAVWDTVASASLPEEIRNDLQLYTGCIAGATPIDEFEAMLAEAGFVSISIKPATLSKSFIRDWAPGRQVEDYVVSAAIEARRPPIHTTR